MNKTISAIFIDIISIAFWTILGKLFNHIFIGLDIGLLINIFGGASSQLLRKIGN